MCVYKYIHNWYLKITTLDIYNIYNSLIYFLADSRNEGEQKILLKNLIL